MIAAVSLTDRSHHVSISAGPSPGHVAWTGLKEHLTHPHPLHLVLLKKTKKGNSSCSQCMAFIRVWAIWTMGQSFGFVFCLCFAMRICWVILFMKFCHVGPLSLLKCVLHVILKSIGDFIGTMCWIVFPVLLLVLCFCFWRNPQSGLKLLLFFCHLIVTELTHLW